jgi:hypothetical protein
MNASLEARRLYKAKPANSGDPMNLKDFTFYVSLLDGRVREISPATGMRLTDTEAIFVIGDVVIERLPRQAIYFVSRQPLAPAVLD